MGEGFSFFSQQLNSSQGPGLDAVLKETVYVILGPGLDAVLKETVYVILGAGLDAVLKETLNNPPYNE